MPLARHAAEDLPWLLLHWAAIESDMSRFHRVDDPEVMSMAVLMRRVRHLPAYGGALALELSAEQRSAAQPSTGYAHAVDDGDTPDEVVAAKWQAALAQQFTPEQMAGGIQTISDTEMARAVRS